MTDLTGQRLGRLVVIERGQRKKWGYAWICKCDCGVVKSIFQCNLISGRKQRSCGCLGRERIKEARTTHGLSNHPLHRVWSDMLSRCYNPKVSMYHVYGGRGIRVSARWRNSFDTFYKDMSPGYKKGLQLDRKKTNGNYTKSNCRWATPSQNCRNTRRNVLITIKGKTKCAMEWAEISGTNVKLIYGRVSRGMNPEYCVFGTGKMRA